MPGTAHSPTLLAAIIILSAIEDILLTALLPKSLLTNFELTAFLRPSPTLVIAVLTKSSTLPATPITVVIALLPPIAFKSFWILLAILPAFVLDLATNFDALNSVYRTGSAFQGNDNSLNYRQLKSYIGLTTKLNKQFELIFEGGYTSFKKINAINSDYSQAIEASMYASFSVRYRFGKSVFDNFLNKQQ